MMDLDGFGALIYLNHRIWVKGVKHTWHGDANLDGEFNSGDLVHVYEVGEYQTGKDASWSEGDWNNDGDPVQLRDFPFA